MKSRKLFLAALVTTLGINMGCIQAQQPPQAQAPQQPVLNAQRSDKLSVGIASYLIIENVDPETWLTSLQQANVQAIREGAVWSKIELKKGEYVIPARLETVVNKAVEKGISPLLVLGGAKSTPSFYGGPREPDTPEAMEAYTRFCEYVVRHFKGKVHMYEIWNEWEAHNVTRAKMPEHQKTLDAYLTLLKKVYPRLKAIDPSVKILGPVMAGANVRRGQLEYEAQHGLLNYVDGVSFHGYMHKQPLRVERTPEAWATWMLNVESMLRKYSGGKEVPLYISEIGWPSNASNTSTRKPGVTPEGERAFLARLYLLAPGLPFIKGVWWYNLFDRVMQRKEGEPIQNYGLVSLDKKTPKPAFYALKDVAGLAAQGKYLGRLPTPDPQLWALKFRRADGQEIWALWSTDESNSRQVTLRRDGQTAQPLQAQRIGSQPTDQKAKLETTSSQLQLTVDNVPYLISGNLSGVTIAAVNKGGALTAVQAPDEVSKNKPQKPHRKNKKKGLSPVLN